MIVYSDQSCGCCGAWVERVRAAGFDAEIVETRGIDRLKAQLGVPLSVARCHTAVIEGYVLEGEVPAVEIRALLDERPNLVGLATPAGWHGPAIRLWTLRRARLPREMSA